MHRQATFDVEYQARALRLEMLCLLDPARLPAIPDVLQWGLPANPVEADFLGVRCVTGACCLHSWEQEKPCATVINSGVSYTSRGRIAVQDI